MKYRFIVVAVVCLLATLIPACVPEPESDTSLVGTWELISSELKSEKGEWLPEEFPQNAKPVGIIIYDDIGNMAVQITTNPRNTESPAEKPYIIHGYSAYYGKYEVDSASGTVTHHRLNDLNPEFSGGSAVRYFNIKDDVLTLTVAPEQINRLKWRRVKVK